MEQGGVQHSRDVHGSSESHVPVLLGDGPGNAAAGGAVRVDDGHRQLDGGARVDGLCDLRTRTGRGERGGLMLGQCGKS